MAVHQGRGVGTIELAVFRADASAAIGGGHVMRCMALAEALEASGGWRCGFATGPDSSAMVPSIGGLDCDPLELSGPAEDEPTALARGWPGGCDLLVVDHYRRDAAFEKACRPWAERIMVIDDMADRPHDCDLLLDQTLGRTAGDYASTTPGTCQLMLGPDFALLRPEFARARGKALARRQSNEAVRRVLVALGASDPDNVTSRVLGGIARSGIDAAIHVVLGAAAPHVETVRDHVAALPQDATLHLGVTDMAALMGETDIAVGAAGTTSWERCCLGLPALILVTADNQRMIATGLENAGAAVVLGWHEAVDADVIADTIAGLVSNPERLAAMSVNAAAVCDGLGATRVREALAA